MFGFGKKKNQEDDKKKVNRALDKVIMGAVIGGAIGSVIGASIAPKEGKQTRKDVAELAMRATEKSKTIFHRIKNVFAKKEQQEEAHEMKQIPSEIETREDNKS